MCAVLRARLQPWTRSLPSAAGTDVRSCSTVIVHPLQIVQMSVWWHRVYTLHRRLPRAAQYLARCYPRYGHVIDDVTGAWSIDHSTNDAIDEAWTNISAQTAAHNCIFSPLIAAIISLLSKHLITSLVYRCPSTVGLPPRRNVVWLRLSDMR